VLSRAPRVFRAPSHPHAAAHVHEHGQLHRPVHFGAEVHDAAGLPGLHDLEVLLRQIGDEPSLAITNDRRHRNEINRRAKTRRRLLFLRLCLRRDSWRSQGEHRSDDADQHRLPPRHAVSYSQSFCHISKLL
jgi:hypothetical protein